MLRRWLDEPHVTKTEWAEKLPDRVEEDFGPSIDGDEPNFVSIVLDSGRPVGIIQDYLIGDYPEWLDDLTMFPDAARLVGIDYLIGVPAAIGRGLGSVLVVQRTAALWDLYPDSPAVLVGVIVDNRPSWRILEKAGFTRVWSGVLESDLETAVATHMYRLNRP